MELTGSGNAEQQHAANTQRGGFASVHEQLVHRGLEHAGHGAHRQAHAVAGPHEQRQHELRRREQRLSHEVAQRGGSAQTSRTIFRK